MKKIMSIAAVAAMMVLACACGNNASKKAAKEGEKAQCEACQKSAGDEVKEAAQEAAKNVAIEAINEGASKASEAIKK
ncbi:MAG: hypothetical protein IJV01_00970 [Bacteroidales bacterium]|nr:hypothetical protein [Bacteroidales bacterium]